METANSAISLLNTSLSLLNKIKKFYGEYDNIPNSVESILRDLESIKDAICDGSQKAELRGNRSWMNDLRRIKLRIEDAVELYDVVFTGHTGHFEGLFARIGGKVVSTGKHMIGPERKLVGYLKEIQNLSNAAKSRVEKYFPQGQAGQTSRNKEDFHHDGEDDPVGLERPIKELVQMLSDSALLRVVAISSPDTSRNKLAKAAYQQVLAREEFTCKAWVTASNDLDGQGLLKYILDGLLGQRQEVKSLNQLIHMLKIFLKNKRYIIGIDGLETASYWNVVLSAFPEDYTSSRIIVTTRREEIAQICRKNCSVYPAKKQQNSLIYRVREHYTESFDEALEAELVQILCRSTPRERRVVAIYGPGGSGKSVLAKAAYNQVQAEEEFIFTAHAIPSPHHNEPRKKLLLDIIDELVGKEGYEGKKSSQLVGELKKILLNKRYIIVIDGLETLDDLSNVISACGDDEMGSRIIVTTTSKEVANICQRNGPIYKMQPLDEDSAKLLLVKKVFRKNEFPETLEIHKMMKMILEACEYLPLAIANMGDYMRSLNINWDYTKCENACINMGSLFEEKAAFRGMKHVLDHSYNSLNGNAKACLLSLSICSKDLFIENYVIKDHVIKGKPLIRRLLAERLIISTTEGIENECFSALIDHNFIVPIEFSFSGHVRTFRINRMMPQFIKGKGDNGNYVTRIDTQQDMGALLNSHTDITRLYIHNRRIDFPKIGEKINVSRVRLLTFHGKVSQALTDFNDYVFLRVLILENCENMKNGHLDTICNQQILRYLSIRGNKDVTMLPKNIVNMRSLETLDTRSTSIDKISMDVILLKELIHLFGKFQITGMENFFRKKHSKREMIRSLLIPQSHNIPIIENSKLQTLAGFFIDETSSDFVTLLLCMPVLRKVRILCWNTPSEKVIQDLLVSLKNCFEKKVGGQNPHLHSLSIDFCASNLNFLDNLRIESPCPLLSLKLCGKLTKLPRFLLSFSDSLNELCLSETGIGGTVLLELQQLKSLQFLKITEHHFKFKEKLIFQSSWFGRLQRLCFKFETLPEIDIQENAIKGLKSLQLLCKELGGVRGILDLKQLEEIIIPNNVGGEGIEKLVEQVRKHGMKPKVLNVDRTSRPLFSRSQAFKERPYFNKE